VIMVKDLFKKIGMGVVIAGSLTLSLYLSHYSGTSSIDREFNAIQNPKDDKKIRNVFGLSDVDNYVIFKNRGRISYGIKIIDNKETRLIRYYDKNKDGDPEEKRTFKIPHKLEVIILP